MIPGVLAAAVDAVVPESVTHVGFIAAGLQGQLMVTEPPGHPHGVSATFSKLRLQPEEAPSRALMRVIAEQIGVEVMSLYPVPNVWATSSSLGYYFVGHLQGYPQEPLPSGARCHWASVDEAAKRISKSQNSVSRSRDQALLEVASSICASPLRRILLMVHELHRKGYERLRAPAYNYPLAWRCPVVPAHWTLKEHGGVLAPTFWSSGPAADHQLSRHTYSSSSSQQPFGWTDMAFAGPRELAARFIAEFPDVAFAGWGPDKDYVHWFDRMLALTAPNGVIASSGEYMAETDFLYVSMAATERVPLPPAGGATRSEWESYESRRTDA